MQHIPRIKEISYSYSTHSDHILETGDDELTWIEGEHELAFCTNVNWVSSSASCDQDDLTQFKGTLVLSNFRLRFLPEDAKLRRLSPINKLLSRFDVVLYNIETIFKVKKKKKKALLPDCLLKEKVERLEIVCKSFQTVVLDFQSTTEDDNNRIIYLLIEAVITSQTDSLMVYARHPDDNYVEVSNLESYWSEELKKCGEKSYRAVTCNESFHVTDSLPKSFVVPSSLSPKDVVAMATKFINNRCPCWTYSCKSAGTSLVRMSYRTPGVQNNIEESVYNSIRSSHPYREYPRVFDLSTLLPSPDEIRSSFDIFKQLCIYDSTRQWPESKWFTQLENSHWLEIISRCLNMAREIAAILSNKGLSVVIKELSSSDLSPVIASLVQLMLEEGCRTIKGFGGLVRKEWVAQGHKFGIRNQSKSFGVRNDPCPIFLVFLDCVYQLTYAKPSAFEFNSNFLVLVWHSICQGLFRDLLFNSPKDLFYTTMKVQMDFNNGMTFSRRNQQNRSDRSIISNKKHPDSDSVGTLIRKSHLDVSAYKKNINSLTNLSQSQSMFSPVLNNINICYDSYSLKKNRLKQTRFSTLSNNKSLNEHNFTSSHLHLTPSSICSSDWSEFSDDLKNLRKSSLSQQRLNSSQILNHSDASYENPWTEIIGDISRGGAATLFDWTFLHDSSQMMMFKSIEYLANNINSIQRAISDDVDNKAETRKFKKSAIIIKGLKFYNYMSFVQDAPTPSDFLKMNFSVPSLSLWSDCHLRFHPSFIHSCIPCSSIGFKSEPIPGYLNDFRTDISRLLSEIQDLEKCLDKET